MRVIVKLLPGRTFSRKESGRLFMHSSDSTAEKPITVSQHVYERFKDAFEVVGQAPEPAPQHTSRVPGTDDESPEDKDARLAREHAEAGEALRQRLQDEGGDDADDEPHVFENGGEFGCKVCGKPEAEHAAVEPPTGDGVAELVAALAGVNLVVDPAVASTWTEAERARARAVVERGGKNTLPAFLKAATSPGE